MNLVVTHFCSWASGRPIFSEFPRQFVHTLDQITLCEFDIRSQHGRTYTLEIYDLLQLTRKMYMREVQLNAYFDMMNEQASLAYRVNGTARRDYFFRVQDDSDVKEKSHVLDRGETYSYMPPLHEIDCKLHIVRTGRRWYIPVRIWDESIPLHQKDADGEMMLLVVDLQLRGYCVFGGNEWDVSHLLEKARALTCSINYSGAEVRNR